MLAYRPLLIVAASLSALLPGAVSAQDAEPVLAETQMEAGTVASIDDPDASGLPESVIDPTVTVAELSHLLIPLTKEELAKVTDAWLANVRAATQEIADLQANIVRDPAQEGDPRYARLIRLVERRAALLERFTMAVDSFERKGGDEGRVADLRAYRKAVLFEETSQASTSALLGSLLAWLGRPDGGIAVLKRVGIAFLALGAIVLAARFARGVVEVWLGRFSKISKLV